MHMTFQGEPTASPRVRLIMIVCLLPLVLITIGALSFCGRTDRSWTCPAAVR